MTNRIRLLKLISVEKKEKKPPVVAEIDTRVPYFFVRMRLYPFPDFTHLETRASVAEEMSVSLMTSTYVFPSRKSLAEWMRPLKDFNSFAESKSSKKSLASSLVSIFVKAS